MPLSARSTPSPAAARVDGARRLIHHGVGTRATVLKPENLRILSATACPKWDRDSFEIARSQDLPLDPPLVVIQKDDDGGCVR
jgi:hypothetical protein